MDINLDPLMISLALAVLAGAVLSYQVLAFSIRTRTVRLVAAADRVPGLERLANDLRKEPEEARTKSSLNSR
ncbi:MAG: hypothetical protein OXI81_16800 [Paracoccaceae bacterium]|nr:hypothetical protein [Paracoccaceae bacterium]